MPTLDFFLTDWVGDQEIETVWPSDVVSSFLTDSEERRSLTTKPRRKIIVTWKGMDRNVSSRILFQLLRSAEESIEIPLYADQAAVTGTAGAVVTCDTTNKRFYAGFKIVIVSPDLQTVERGTILSLTAADITLTAALVASFGVNSLIFPIMDVLPVLGHSMRYETDELLTLEAAFKEIPGTTALPSLVPTFGDNPTGFPVISTFPVLNLPHNWSLAFSAGIGRTGANFNQGKGPDVQIAGLKPIMNFRLDLSPLTRAESFSFLEFFDSRRGRCLPFWIIPPHSAFRATQDIGPNVTIEALENLSDISDFVSWVAVEELDGTIHIEALASVASLSATEWRLDPSTPFPAIPLAQVSRVSMGHLVRFSSDANSERWGSDGVGLFEVGVTELVNEATVEVANL